MLDPLRSINEILGLDFFIPSYQRGYRWEEDQVLDLLDDIWDFFNLPNKKKGEFYCLQPIIVKKSDHSYRLIDGQQRLTTIYIILTCLEDVAKVLFNSSAKFSIEYETRENSRIFLENLSNCVEIDSTNIDYHFISKAYLTVQEWIENKNINKADFLNTLLKVNKDEEGNDIANNVRVIWYEIKDKDNEIDVFTRINSGKIPLTNAELIKSLFLNSKNFNGYEKDIRQIEISKEWDEIEYALQRKEFWYFLVSNKDYPTRIELIFEILSKITSKGKYDIYRHFVQKKKIVNFWSKEDENVKKVFLTLQDWFNNRKMYHLVGFLIATNSYNIKKIYEGLGGNTKTEFTKIIYKRIIDEIDFDKIDQLEYGLDNYKIQRLLLLFNIATILNNKESYVRFAFDRFNKDSWSLEHIHAQKDLTQGHDAKKVWLEETNTQIESLNTDNNFDEIIGEINVMGSQDVIDGDTYKELRNKIFKMFGQPDINTIDNMALLPRNVNTSLSNNIFPVKRKILIDKDKNGEFIPICTKNVFLKYYSENVKNTYCWSDQDRQDYLVAIKTVLSKFKSDIK